MKYRHIRVREDIYEMLQKKGNFGDSFSKIIARMLGVKYEKKKPKKSRIQKRPVVDQL